MSLPTLAQLIAHTKKEGFCYPSSEIYGGLQAVYDYGPYGILLKRELQAFWWESMTQMQEAIVGLDASILMAPRTWEASGHLTNFHDWMVDHKDSKKRYRVDQLLEEKAKKWQNEGKQAEASALLKSMRDAIAQGDGAALTALLQLAKISCPIAKNSNFTQARRFNLMFATKVGSVEGKGQTIYLRPETAQGIFLHFLNVQQGTGKKLPLGIAQIGKAFRNEIVARQFLFRMREFEQMEMQFFCAPATSLTWFERWKKARCAWYQVLGIQQEVMRMVPHQQLAHYATQAVDLEYAFDFGWKEVEGIHNRGDFDLKQHSRFSGKKITYFDPVSKTAYIPHVIETSVGSDRLFLLFLSSTWRQNEKRTYFAFPPPLAPLQLAVLPLFNKPQLVELAQKVAQPLRSQFRLTYAATGSIGKRYVRQDLIGTPFCITIDYQSLEDESVTIRERDTMLQRRISINQLSAHLAPKVARASLLKALPAL